MLAICVFAIYNALVSANSCTDAADASSTGYAAVICGTDFVTHYTHYSSFEDDSYAVCGVMTYYEGVCGCPNDCYAERGNGVCNTSKMLCECSDAYGGLDCAQPKCPSNSCHSHGKCIQSGDKNSLFPFDYCECDADFTGTDCGSMVNNVETAPWGNVLGKDQQEYNGKDDYEDDHPVFNISVLATIHVTMAPEDYLYCLQPWNLFNQTYVHATLHFDNGNVQETLSDVGIRIKGGSSRMNQKKGWAISMDQFDDTQRLTDLNKIELKPSTDGPDSMVIAQLYADFARAVGAPVQRSSYALM